MEQYSADFSAQVERVTLTAEEFEMSCVSCAVAVAVGGVAAGDADDGGEGVENTPGCGK